MAKQLHFNKDGSALKKMQAGVDKLASVVGITLGPKVAYVVEYCQHGYLSCPSLQHAFVNIGCTLLVSLCMALL